MLARAVDELPAPQRRSAAVRAAGVRDDRLREGVDQRAPTPGASASSATPIAITMNRERLMADAKACALERVREGYQRAGAADGDSGRRRRRAGARSSSASTSRGAPAASAITTPSSAARSPTILAGGALPHQTTVSEQHLLDLEREAFLEAVRRAKDARADSAHAENRKAV